MSADTPSRGAARRAGASRGTTAARGPTLRTERSVLRSCGAPVVVGMDEVGRGALAGPVTVGAVAVCLDTPTAPRGLHDSKLLSPDRRERLVPRVRRWAVAWGVGHAGNDEIDRWGILCALRVAGMRALDHLAARLPVADRDSVTTVILDGSYDWLRRPPLPGTVRPSSPEPATVHLLVRADQRCAAVAGASVLAKVERDAHMTLLGCEDDRYGWADNKGYAAPGHRAALDRYGPSAYHRRSWNILRDRAPDDGDAATGQDVLMPDTLAIPGGPLQGVVP